MSPPDENTGNLWTLTFSPVIWAAHFMTSYVTVAIWCAKVTDPTGPLGGARMAIAAYTVVALFGIGVIGWQGYRRRRHGTETVPHAVDTPENRQRFLGFATLLLSGLSAVATLYSSLAPLFIGSCQ